MRFRSVTWASSLLYAFFAALTAAVFLRLFYSINFLDEAYYVGLPYTFALGNRPLVNELFLTQLSGVLVEPVVYLFLEVFGSTNGLVLFVRCLFFMYSLLCCGLAVVFLRGRIRLPLAVFAAGILITFVPASIPSLSYNTLGYLGFASGALLTAHGLLATRPARFLVLGSLFHACAALAYPPLVLAAGISIVTGFWFCSRREERPRLIAALAIVALIVLLAALLPLVIVLDTSPDDLARVRDYVHSYRYGNARGGWEKVVALLLGSRRQWRFVGSLCTVVLGLWFVRKLHPSLSWLTLLVVPPLCLWLFLERGYAWEYPHLMFIALGLLPAVLLPLMLFSHRIAPRELLPEIAVWLWSLGAGLSTGWASGNGILNAQLGLVPAALIGVLWLLRLGSFGAPGRAPVFICLVGSLQLVQLVNLFSFVYFDAPMPALTARVTEGPFMGLYTTPQRREFLHVLRRDVRAMESQNTSIVFLDDFPGGYLFTSLKPQVPTVWIFGNWDIIRYDRAVLRRYYTSPEMLPDVVVRLLAIPIGGRRDLLRLRPRPHDQLVQLFSAPPYKLRITRRPYYLIYERVRG